MKKSLLIASAATLAALSAPASACDPIPGALIFGGIGAAIGNAPGAAIGAILGSAITGSAPCPGYYRDDRVYYERGYDRGYDRRYEPAYERGPDVGYYDRPQYAQREVIVERRAPPVYYAPAYYPPVYYAPPIVYSYGKRYYEPRYYAARHYRHDDRRWYR